MTEGYGPRFVLMCVSLVLIVFGLGGFFSPTLFSTCFSPARCAFILTHGAISLVVVYLTRYWILRGFCLCSAAVYGGLTWLGYVQGIPGMRKVGEGFEDPRLIVLFDGRFEFGQQDHKIHLVLAAAFLIVSVLPKAWDAEAGRTGGCRGQSDPETGA